MRIGFRANRDFIWRTNEKNMS